MNAYVILIRAIGPETHKRMSMAALREGCAAAGLSGVSTYIATGNVLFRSAEAPETVARLVRGVLAAHGLDNAVFVRTPDELEVVRAACPLPQAAVERPARLLVSFMDAPPDRERFEALLRHPGPERVAAAGRELFIDYVDGVGRSKLTPAVIERRLGQPGTARNWTTVGALATRARALAG